MDRTHSFGYWVRRRRKALDLSQRELAERAACSLSAIKKIEGDTRRPSLELAEILAGCLAIPESERESFLNSARGLAPVDELPLANQPVATVNEAASQMQPATEATGAISKPKRLTRRSRWSVLAVAVLLVLSLVIFFFAAGGIQPFRSLIPGSITETPASANEIIYGAENPESVLNTMVEAAQTGDFIPLYGLCDPLSEHDEHAARVCAMATAKAGRQFFRRVFAESEVVGEIVYSQDGLLAEMTFSHGPSGGVIKTAKLVQRDGRWYLLTWPPMPDNKD